MPTLRALAPPFQLVLVIGDPLAPPVARLLQFLQDRTTVTHWRHPRRASTLPSEHESFDLIVLTPSIRNEWGEQEVQWLASDWPLALVVVLVGASLEGETRSGRPWRGCLRLYWDQFEPQWELADRSQNEARSMEAVRPLLSWRPPTELAEERVTTGPCLPHAVVSSDTQGHVWIHASIADNRHTLRDVCQWAGWQVTLGLPDRSWLRSGSAVVLYDAARQAGHRERELRWLQQLAPGVPIVMLLDFPRYNERLSAEAMGVTRVLGKPYRIEELAESLRRAVDSQTSLRSHS